MTKVALGGCGGAGEVECSAAAHTSEEETQEEAGGSQYNPCGEAPIRILSLGLRFESETARLLPSIQECLNKFWSDEAQSSIFHSFGTLGPFCQVNSDDLLRMRVVFRSMSEAKPVTNCAVLSSPIAVRTGCMSCATACQS